MAGPWRVYPQVLDGRRTYVIGRLLDETQPPHRDNMEYIGRYMENRDEAVSWMVALNGQVPTYLKTVPTCHLVAELATREGVTEFSAGPQDRYLVRVKTVDAVTTADFDLGPARILVVVDR